MIKPQRGRAAQSPASTSALFAQAITHHQAGRRVEAEQLYQRILAMDKRHADSLHLLGVVAYQDGRFDVAADLISQAIRLRGSDASFFLNLGNALQAQQKLDAAIARFEQAVALRPDFAQALYNLGNALQDQGQLDAAIARYRQALSISPDYVTAHSNLLYCLNYHSGLSAQEIYAQHRLWDARHGGERACLRRDPDPSETHMPQRRLRVAYVSPDLRQHAVACFFEPLLREHDRRAMEIFCYADVVQPDAVTARLQSLSDHWLSTVGMPDEMLARRIVEDRIDILVDLAGHTGDNRLSLFACKPAPIQVNWLGYPHSTGLRAMDYRLVDEVSDPQGTADALASESLVRLPGGFLCYEAPPTAPLPSQPPCLEGAGITFGSFNNPVKLSTATLDAWGALLQRLPKARLLLKGKLFADTAACTAILAQLEQRGVKSARVTVLGMLPDPSSHLALYSRVDIALDPFPYNGTTTSCEALWMGVPVVTLCGDRHAARVGASLLTQVGLSEFIATSVADYIDIAATLAADPQRLVQLRRSLRARLAASPLCDAPAFARKMESAYRGMWQRYNARLCLAHSQDQNSLAN